MKSYPIAIDVFCGAGGLSEGLQMAGFSVAVAVENDKNAASTYKRNHSNTVLISKDISDLTVNELLDAVGRYSSEIDIIAGGPPVSRVFNGKWTQQAYSQFKQWICLAFCQMGKAN